MRGGNRRDPWDDSAFEPYGEDDEYAGYDDPYDFEDHEEFGERPRGQRQRSRVSPLLVVGFAVLLAAGVGGFALFRHLTSVGQEPAAPAEEQAEDGRDESSPDVEERVNRVIDGLTLEQKVAQLFVVRPESITGVGLVVAAGDATRDAVTQYPVGGICYFAENLESPKQAREMIRNTQKYAKDACGLPMFICVDEEGGTVVRVADNPAFGVSNVGDMADIGASGDPEQARAAARTMGTYLSELGFNVDFAPVADIATSEDGTMEQRSFGSDPEAVAPMVVAQVDGFRRGGVLCAVKHFPGIGGAEGDSHNGRIYSHRKADEMASWELVPFAQAIEADVPMVMVGHISCLEVGQGEGDLPASLSPAIMQGMLRGDLGYEGVIITDSFEMGALDGVCDPSEQAVRAIQAGADIVLMPEDFTQAYRGLLDAARDGTISEERIDESLRRIVRLKLTLNA